MGVQVCRAANYNTGCGVMRQVRVLVRDGSVKIKHAYLGAWSTAVVRQATCRRGSAAGGPKSKQACTVCSRYEPHWASALASPTRRSVSGGAGLVCELCCTGPQGYSWCGGPACQACAGGETRTGLRRVERDAIQVDEFGEEPVDDGAPERPARESRRVGNRINTSQELVIE